MVDVIETAYADPITLRTFSARVGRQPAYLGRLFRQETGATVREYLTRVRLDRAAELIREGVKIEAVALLVGYRSKKNFYRQFKRYYGTTPVPFRGHCPPSRPEETKHFVVCAPPSVAVAAEKSCSAVLPLGLLEAGPDPLLKRMELVFRASRRAWRLAVRAQELMLQNFTRMRIGMLLTNDKGRYIGANHAASRITGYLTRELYRSFPTDLFMNAPSVDTRCVWQIIVQLTENAPPGANTILRTKDGRSVAVRLLTVKNLLWGRREMSAMFHELAAAAS